MESTKLRPSTGRVRARPTGGAQQIPPAIPPWIDDVDVAVWVSDDDMRMRHLNTRAEQLLGVHADRCVGEPCDEVIAGLDDCGERFCSRRCPWFQAATCGAPLTPVVLDVGRGETAGRWAKIVCVPVRPSAGPEFLLVHCALDVTRSRRIERYLGRVAARTPPALRMHGRLTARQREVLDHLSDDEDLPTIAKTLHVSHTTVRNHVQHILAALGVHSMAEAVAVHLLESAD